MEQILVSSVLFPPQNGGIQTVAYEISRAIQSLEKEVIVLAPDYKGSEIFDSGKNMDIVRNKYLNKKYIGIFAFIYLTLKLCKKKKINKIIATTWTPSGLSAMIASKLFKIKYYVIAHGNELYPENKWKKKLMKIILKNADNIIVPSSFTKDIVNDLGYSANTVFWGIDYDRFQNIDENISNEIKKRYDLYGKKVILTLARLDDRKGQDLVIEALSKLNNEHSNLVYIIGGTGSFENRLRELKKKFKLDNVHFLGRVPDNELVPLFNLSDIYIMPSKDIIDSKERSVEGFGLVYLEANACGKPVIGGNTGGTPDAIINGETGLLIDADEKSVYQALSKLLNDDQLSKEMGEKGRKRAKTMSWKNTSENILRLIS